MSLKYLGKTMAFILRHHPEEYGVTLDEHGWAKVDELITAIAKDQKFNREMLEEIVATDNKQRYSFNEDKTLIRANQGHSIPVDVELRLARDTGSLRFSASGRERWLRTATSSSSPSMVSG